VRVTGFEVLDVRFPTSLGAHGSDAMHTDPDYSCAYLVLETSGEHTGHGFTFTLGRGTEIVCTAIRSLVPSIVGAEDEALFADLGGLARRLASDSQMRWIGPEKGVLHLATAAVLNAVWDLYAKTRGKPLWELVATMPPSALVSLVDFRYLSDALTPQQALDVLRAREPGRADRIAELRERGIPAYITSAGWIGYTEDEVTRRCKQAVADGFTHLKMKVGADPETDRARASVMRSAIGDLTLMMDANQVWDVDEAIAAMRHLSGFDPWWIEEPTSPDDILGHARIAEAVAPIKVATGEMCHNRVMFKQFMQARAMGICQIDSCRLGSVNEVLAVLLLAERFGVPVCPHAGGVGLCELVQHLAAIDAIAVSETTQGRVVEFADHLHEHFVDPVDVRDGAYRLPTAPGYSAEMHAASLRTFTFTG
jgi:L-fuconate dehydratase